MPVLSAALVLALIVGLAAFAGQAQAQQANQPPNFASSAITVSIYENQSITGRNIDVTAQDPDGDDRDIEYEFTVGNSGQWTLGCLTSDCQLQSVSDGSARWSLFTEYIRDGNYVPIDKKAKLVLNSPALDYESLQNPDEVYQAVVRATDEGGAIATTTVTVSIRDEDEPPLLPPPRRCRRSLRPV